MSQRQKAWGIVGVIVIVLGVVGFWQITEENKRADKMQAVLISDCERELNLAEYGLMPGSWRIEMLSVSHDRASSKTTGTYRNPLPSDEPVHNFACEVTGSTTIARIGSRVS